MRCTHAFGLMPGILAAVVALAALLPAQSTRTYTHDNLGNRTNATNQVRFTSAAGFFLSPPLAVAGDRVNLFGRNFPAGREADVTLSVGGAAATIVSAASRVITFTMPASAQTGDVLLSIVGGPQNQLVGRLTLRGVQVTPATVELANGASFTFAAQVRGAVNPAVTWRVNNIPGGNGSVGTITAGGIYTAPAINSGTNYPYTISAHNAELNMVGYAVVKPLCDARTTIANRTLVSAAFANNSLRHCYEFTAAAGEYCFVALQSELSVQSMLLRGPDGTVVASTTSGTDLRLPDALLPAGGTYQIEVLGNTFTYGPYQLYVDRHPPLPRGVWLTPFSGTWQTANHWSRGELPQASDPVVIGSFASDVTVTVSSGIHACAAITSGERLEVTGGTLAVGGTVQVNAQLRLAGGRLRNAIVLPGTGGIETQLTNATLDNVVFAANTVLRQASSGTVTIERGVTCDGTWNVDSGTIQFVDSGAFQGIGNVYLGATSSAWLYATTGVTLTLAPSLSVRVRTGTIGANDSAFVARGVIHAIQTGSTLNLRGTGWENAGVIDAVPGSTVTTFGSWRNTGLVRSVNATVNLGGTFQTGDLGNFQHVGGTVNLTGTLQNTGATLTIGSTMLNWRVVGGTIVGGEVATQAPAQLLFDGNGVLDGVRLRPGAVARNLSSHQITIRNGLTVDGTFYVHNGTLLANGTQTLGGTGVVDVGGNGTGYLYGQTNTTLTIAAGLTVRVGAGYVGWSNDHIRNQGTIRADRQGGTLYLRGASWRNEGLVEAQNGCSINVDTPATTNLGTLTETYGTLTLGGTWSNSGTINLVVANANLGGVFSLSTLGTLNALASEVVITGTLQNTPDLVLSATTGSWFARGGAILDGCRITTLDATELICDGTTELRGVAVQAGGTVRVVSATVNVRGNLTVHGSLLANNANVYMLDDGAQLQGTGTVALGPSTSLLRGVANQAWTLAAGVTVDVSQGYVGYQAGTFLQRGTVRCGVAGGNAYVGGTSWTNFGTLEAHSGGSVECDNAWTNSGNLVVGQASTLRLHGTFTNSATGSATNNGGEVWVTGTFTHAGPWSMVGTWRLRGTMVGARLQTAQGGELVCDSGGTLDNVTIDPGAMVRVINGNTVNLRNGLLVNGSLRLDRGNLLATTNNLAISGSGVIELASTSSSRIWGNTGIGWSIEPGLTVRCTGPGLLGNNTDTFVLRGLVSAEAPSGSVTLDGAGWDNQGKIHVRNNCRLRLQGNDWRNSTGTIVQQSGTVELAGTFGPMALGAFTPSGGEVHVLGTCDVAGGTLTLNPTTTGTWRMRGGSIRNGTLAGTELLFDSTGTLDGMTLAAGAQIRAINGNEIRVANGITNHATMRLDHGNVRIMTAGSTLAGTGVIEMGNSTASSSDLYASTVNIPWTIGPSLTIRALGSGQVGAVGANENIVNLGSIRAEGPANRTLRINGTFDNQGAIVCGATATLRLDGNNWRNTTGTITQQGGLMQLAGTFPHTALGTFTATGGDVHLLGTCEIGSATFTLGPATTGGTWHLRGGTIISASQNGTLAMAPGSELLVDGTGTLDGMRIAAGALVRVTGGNTLNIRTSFHVDGRLLMDSGWTQLLTSAMTIGGTGSIEFGNSSTSTSYFVGGGRPWTFGAGLTVRAVGTAQIGNHGNDTWVNQGLLRAETPSRILTIANSGWSNRGRIEVVGGGRINATTLTQNDAAAVTVVGSGSTLQAAADLQQGRLEGAGTIQGNVVSAGTVRPGGAAAAGTLTVTGTFTQTAAGRIEIELGGTTPGTGHDRLAVTGAATFAGALVASTLSGYVPPNPSQFDVVTYSSRTGTLTFTPPGGVGMTPNYQATLLRLTVP